MSDASRSAAEPVDPVPMTGAPYRVLRIWPVAVLLVLLWVLHLGPYFIDGLGMAGFMVAGFSPLVCGLLMGVWWVAASRARWFERLWGALGAIAVTAIASAVADPTLKGFWICMFGAPSAVTAFGLGMLLVHRWRSPARVPVALLFLAVTFGYWDLLRFDGMTGEYASEFSWRWEPTKEQLNASRLKAAPATAASEPIDLGPVKWAGFRGPNRDGRAPGIVLESDWKAHPPKTLWTKAVGPGWSSFAVQGNRLFTQEQRGEKEAIVAWDTETGDTCWVVESPARFDEPLGGPGPRGTPTLAEGKLFAQGATGLLHCVDPSTGEVIWKQDIHKDSARAKPPEWGYSASPLVTHGLAILHAGGEKDRGVLAYDIKDGQLQWSVPAGSHTYSSAQLATFDGREYVLMLTNTGLTIIDPEKGQLAFEHKAPYGGYRVIQPLVFNANNVLLGTGMGEGTQKVSLTVTAGKMTAGEKSLWKTMSPDFNDFVAHKGYLYGFDQALFACVDLATGKRQWKKGRYGKGQVLLLPDADQLLVLSEKGEAVLLKASPKDLEELARFQVIEGKTWNHPVLVGDRLYARNGEQVACVVMPVRTGAKNSGKPKSEL